MSATLARSPHPPAEPVALGTAEIFAGRLRARRVPGRDVPAGRARADQPDAGHDAGDPRAGRPARRVHHRPGPVSCRSGARARALVVATAVDAGPEAAAWLAAGWGIGGDEGGRCGTTAATTAVRVTAPWFDVTIDGPRPIGVDDVQYVTGLHPVVTDAGERLAQVELEITPAPHRAGPAGAPLVHRAAPGPPGLDPAVRRWPPRRPSAR